MSDEKRRKLASTNSRLLPSINYKQSISLVLLLLVTFTSPSSQSPLTQHGQQEFECPRACECDATKYSAKCTSMDGLIESYSQKTSHFMPIKSLDLSNNRLTKISNQLELLVNLTELNLSHNKLTQVHKLNFAHLETLNLSHNRITSGKLAKLPKNVQQLDLSHNEITYLPSDFMKLKELKALELSGNPLNCSCDTLMIRNWIQFQRMWTDEAIKCASPQIFKGQPWIQARQNEVCIEAVSTSSHRPGSYNWDEIEDDNEVMMGDQPADDDNDGEGHVPEGRDTSYEYDDNEPKTAAVKEEGSDNNSQEDLATTYANLDESNEDSHPFDDPTPLTVEDEKTNDETTDDTKIEEDEDFIPVSPKDSVDHSSESPDHVEVVSEGSGGEEVTSNEPEEDSGSGDEGSGGIIDHFIPPLGIFNDSTSSTSTTTEEPLLAAGVQKDKVDVIPNPMPGTQENTKTAQIEDNTGTYILLAIIGILLVSLIIFVAMKNKQEKRKNKRRYDVEKEGKNGGTELMDMDKRLLGKPIEKNGNGRHEHSPLVTNDPKEDGFRPYKAPAITVDEPRLEVPQKEKGKSHDSLYENNLPNGNTFEPIEPVHNGNGVVPKSPDSDDEIFHPASDDPEALNVTPEKPKRYSPIYNPVSPRSARYSPVYSPETGRVKIKLTETPKPKTPVVVTRSRSRAGDYVNTPNN